MAPVTHAEQGRPMKRCTKCRQEQPVERFYRNKHRPDGREAWCKPCCAERARRYRQAKPEQGRAAMARYYARHKAAIRERARRRDAERLHRPGKASVTVSARPVRPPSHPKGGEHTS
jgi:hypothetical protein